MEKPRSYWEKMEAYKKLKLDTSLSWHKLYDDERIKREEIEAKYEALTKKLRDAAYYEKLAGLAKDDGEPWDDERMDIIGQNGNEGLHYVANDDGTSVKVQHKLKE